MTSWDGWRRRPGGGAAERKLRAAGGGDPAAEGGTAADAVPSRSTSFRTVFSRAARSGTAPSRTVRDGLRPEPMPEAARPEGVEPVREGPGRAVRVLVTVLALAAMVAFAVVLARLTLGESPASVPLTHDNLSPGSSIRAYLSRPAFVDTVKQLGGNVALGVPFGLLLPLISRKARGVVRVALLTAATMLVVELIQGALITGRAFDIDDALLNTAGALLGYFLIGRRLGRAVHPRRRRRWWRRAEGTSA